MERKWRGGEGGWSWGREVVAGPTKITECGQISQCNGSLNCGIVHHQNDQL